MNSKPNYTMIGGFVLVLSAVGLLFIFWLTSLKYHAEYNTYVIYMHEEISGLSIDAPVRYNGVKVGYVNSIELNPNDPQQVMVFLKIREGTPVTTSTIAALKSEGITGVDYIGLTALTPQAPPLKAKPGEKYPVIPVEPSLLLKLGTALQEVTKTIKDLGNNINQMFSPPNIEAVHDSLQNLKSASKTFPQISKQLQHTLINLSPQIQQMSSQLNATSANVEELSEELKQNPSILIRGRTAPPPGPGEK